MVAPFLFEAGSLEFRGALPVRRLTATLVAVRDLGLSENMDATGRGWSKKRSLFQAMVVDGQDAAL